MMMMMMMIKLELPKAICITGLPHQHTTFNSKMATRYHAETLMTLCKYNEEIYVLYIGLWAIKLNLYDYCACLCVTTDTFCVHERNLL